MGDNNNDKYDNEMVYLTQNASFMLHGQMTWGMMSTTGAFL